MNLNYQDMVIQAQHRQRALQAESEKQRIVTQMMVYQVAHYRRLLANLGEIMIVSGTRLKTRYAAKTPLHPAAPFMPVENLIR